LLHPNGPKTLNGDLIGEAFPKWPSFKHRNYHNGLPWFAQTRVSGGSCKDMAIGLLLLDRFLHKAKGRFFHEAAGLKLLVDNLNTLKQSSFFRNGKWKKTSSFQEL